MKINEILNSRNFVKLAIDGKVLNVSYANGFDIIPYLDSLINREYGIVFDTPLKPNDNIDIFIESNGYLIVTQNILSFLKYGIPVFETIQYKN
jgi:hypothetical protein